jgi:hypothetical protein
LILLYILTPSNPTTETTHGFYEEDVCEESDAQKEETPLSKATGKEESEEATRQETRQKEGSEKEIASTQKQEAQETLDDSERYLSRPLAQSRCSARLVAGTLVFGDPF